ncbi:hypothetical protein F183_A21440 [Bryobacterales bacterium F-183]|nr:hypothetical protein F183_A21440 [Bryobacterales bacterium F-183]
MTAALLDRSFEVRADAIKTLWQYNTPVNVVNEEQVRSVCSALGLALDSEDIQVRNAAMHAIRLLGKAGSVILKKVQQRAREMAGTASARIAFDSLIALGPDSNSKKLLVDIASKGSRRVAPVESIDVDLAVRLAELPQQQWGEPDAVIVDSIAAAFERGDWLLDRADMKVLFESGQRGSQHVIRFALNSPYSLKCLALRTLGRAGVAEHTLILYKALVNDEDKSVAGCAADGLKASLEQAVTLQNSPHQVLLKAGVEPRLLVGWLKRVPNWGASSDTAVELLALLDETPETVAAFAVRHLRQNKYFRRPTILANDSEFAAAFTLSLFEVLDTKQVEPHVFELLRAYPEQVRQAVPRIITAAREATPEGRLEAMRLLLATSPADPSVIDYLRRCAFDEDLTLSYEASWTLYKRGYKEIAVQLHAIAVKQIEAGAEKDGFATVTELAWPLNKLDPLIEVTAIERYLERLFRSLIEDDTFEGELRTPSPATHAPTAAENASDNWNLPRFSWPPPEYSERDNITDLFGNAGDISLGTIDNHIQSALRLKGYGVGGLYRIKGGFLRAAKLEQLSQERQQVPSKYRFLTAPIPPQSLVDYLGQLFLARSGIFRLILFAVTSAPVVGDETTQITIEQARTTFLHGDPGQLPTDVQTMQLGRRRVYVLIYEFEKKMGRSRQVIPSPLMARDHLVKAGLLELLSRRAK